MKAAAVLTPAMSKHLIAQGVAAHPIVIEALQRQTLIVTLGTTNAYVASALLGEPVDHGAFAAGLIERRWTVNARLGEATDLVLHHGKSVPFDPDRTIADLSAGDVVIKGANAVDPEGVAGVLLASDTGGTIGRYLPSIIARGVQLIIPISVAKSVHTPMAMLSMEMGSRRLDLAMGLPCGLFPLHGRVITEIEALALVHGVHATHICSSGVGQGIGSVSLLIEGEEQAVRAAFTSIQSLSDQPEIPVQGRG